MKKNSKILLIIFSLIVLTITLSSNGVIQNTWLQPRDQVFNSNDNILVFSPNSGSKVALGGELISINLANTDYKDIVIQNSPSILILNGNSKTGEPAQIKTLCNVRASQFLECDIGEMYSLSQSWNRNDVIQYKYFSTSTIYFTKNGFTSVDQLCIDNKVESCYNEVSIVCQDHKIINQGRVPGKCGVAKSVTVTTQPIVNNTQITSTNSTNVSIIDLSQYKIISENINYKLVLLIIIVIILLIYTLYSVYKVYF